MLKVAIVKRKRIFLHCVSNANNALKRSLNYWISTKLLDRHAKESLFLWFFFRKSFEFHSQGSQQIWRETKSISKTKNIAQITQDVPTQIYCPIQYLRGSKLPHRLRQEVHCESCHNLRDAKAKIDQLMLGEPSREEIWIALNGFCQQHQRFCQHDGASARLSKSSSEAQKKGRV